MHYSTVLIIFNRVQKYFKKNNYKLNSKFLLTNDFIVDLSIDGILNNIEDNSKKDTKL